MRDFLWFRGAAAGVAGLLVAAVSVIGSPAWGHDLWLVPSSFHPAPGAQVSVGILVGHGPEDAMPLTPRPEWIERFVLAGPAGETPVTALPGADPPGWVAVGEGGLYAIGLESAGTLHTLTPEHFARYLAEEGLEERARQAVRSGQAPTSSDGPVRELFARSVKSLVRVGEVPLPDRSSAPGPPFGPLLGQPLELVPLADPSAPEATELPLRVLLRGEPAKGVLVEMQPLSGGVPRSTGVTGSDGVARLALPAAASPTGWLVSAVVLEPAPPDSEADWRSLWSSLTFERRPR